MYVHSKHKARTIFFLHFDVEYQGTPSSIQAHYLEIDWLNDWVLVYELGGCELEFRCSHLIFRYSTGFEQGVTWHYKKNSKFSTVYFLKTYWWIILMHLINPLFIWSPLKYIRVVVLYNVIMQLFFIFPQKPPRLR